MACPAPTHAWREEASNAQQQHFLSLLGEHDWDAYQHTEIALLEVKIGCFLFGPCNSDNLGSDVLLLIKKLSETIVRSDGHVKSSNKEIWMTVVYVSRPVNDVVHHEPVFKVPKDTEGHKSLYIDIYARVYQDWNDYLKHNLLPPCEYCYPKDGIYIVNDNDEVVLEFGKSPASHTSEKILTGLDYASLGVSAVAAAALFLPVGGPLVAATLWAGGACSVYSTVRSSGMLIDRAKHNQSIGLKDPQSRNCWLSIASSSVGLASMSASATTVKMAQTGRVLGRAGCATVTALNMSSFTLNSLGLLNHAVGLKEKFNHGELSTLDVIQFSAALFLFAHAAVCIKTAESIIKDTQSSVLKEFEANLRSNRHRKVFKRVAQNTRDQHDVIRGNAKIIRSIRHIDNVDDFVASLARMDKQVCCTKSKITIAEQGFIDVNQKLTVNPMKLSKLDKAQRVILFKATKNFALRSISEEQFQNLTSPILEKVSSVTLLESSNVRNFPGGKSFMTNKVSRSILACISSYDKAIITAVLSNFAVRLQNDILNVAIEICRRMKWTEGRRFCEVVYFVCGFIKSTADELEIDAERNSGHSRSNVNWENYCYIALTDIVPEVWLEIFTQCSNLYKLMTDRKEITIKYDHMTWFEIAQLGSIFLKFDGPLYERLIDTAIGLFQVLRCKKGEAFFIIIKLLSCYIKKAVNDMEEKYQDDIARGASVWDIACKETNERFKHLCTIVLEAIEDDYNVKEALKEKLIAGLPSGAIMD